MNKIRSFTIKFKLEMVKMIEQFGMKHCIQNSNINKSLLYKWKSRRHDLLQEQSTSRKIGSGRKPLLDIDTETTIITWIRECNQHDILVNHKSVRDYCIEKYGNISSFSKDWFRRFKNRFNLTTRRVTSHSKRPKHGDSNTTLQDSIKTFREKISTVQKTLLNMDETPVWFDMPSKYTVTTKGTKHVSLRATSNQKKRITVVLACKSNGEKLPPVVILKNKYNGIIPNGILVWYQSKAWMDSKLSLEWLNKFSTKNDHLIWDSCSGHKAELLNDKLSTIEHTYIPPGTTANCQPLDVGLNKPFKDRLKEKWNNWARNQMGLTKNGSWKSASIEQLLNWIKEAWGEISTSAILNSFKKSLEQLQ